MTPLKTLAAGLAVCLLPMGLAWGDTNPSYTNSVLTIPSVSTDGQVGQYRDAKLRLGGDGVWRLDAVKVLGGEVVVQNGAMVSDGLFKLSVGSVELVKTTGVPVQVFLRVRGDVGGCATLGAVSQRLVDGRFEVLLTDGTTSSTYAVVACTADIRAYAWTVPLSVYGLSAGTYSYIVNGSVTGSFTLEADNVLSGGCQGVGACQQ